MFLITYYISRSLNSRDKKRNPTLKAFTVLLGNNNELESFKPIWKMLNSGYMNLPKEQKIERRRKKAEEEEGEECYLSTLLWEDGGFTSIIMPGLCLRERCVSMCQTEKGTQSMKEHGSLEKVQIFGCVLGSQCPRREEAEKS